MALEEEEDCHMFFFCNYVNEMREREIALKKGGGGRNRCVCVYWFGWEIWDERR